MKHTLLLDGESVFLLGDAADLRPIDQLDSEQLNQLKSAGVELVLRDPSYVSSACIVDLKRRRDRKVMAESRFAELAGERALGNWCVIPEGKGHRLYLLALDPASAEARAIDQLISQGLEIDSVSSVLMQPNAIAGSDTSVLRIVVQDSIVKISLRKCGIWVFARRVEDVSVDVGQAIEVTLEYLRSQDYLSLPFDGRCEVGAENAIFEELQGLWEKGGLIRSSPSRISLRVDTSQKENRGAGFNCIPRTSENPSNSLARGLLIASAALFACTLAYALPLQLLTKSEFPMIKVDREALLSEDLQRQYWVGRVLSEQSIVPSEAVVKDLRLLHSSLIGSSGITVRGVAVESQRGYRVSCALGHQYADPLLKRKIFAELRSAVANKLPHHRVTVEESGGHSLDSGNKESSFELVLEYAHATG